LLEDRKYALLPNTLRFEIHARNFPLWSLIVAEISFAESATIPYIDKKKMLNNALERII
jgi:hypothetical protein